VIGTNSANFILEASTLSNTSGMLQHNGTGSFTITTPTLLDNTGGLIISKDGALAINAGTLKNRMLSRH
jgi:filamentous hemagglutinin